MRQGVGRPSPRIGGEGCNCRHAVASVAKTAWVLPRTSCDQRSMAFNLLITRFAAIQSSPQEPECQLTIGGKVRELHPRAQLAASSSVCGGGAENTLG